MVLCRMRYYTRIWCVVPHMVRSTAYGAMPCAVLHERMVLLHRVWYYVSVWCYAARGTDGGYGATPAERGDQLVGRSSLRDAPATPCPVLSWARLLLSSYATSGTYTGYVPLSSYGSNSGTVLRTRSVLRSGMLLPGIVLTVVFGSQTSAEWELEELLDRCVFAFSRQQARYPRLRVTASAVSYATSNAVLTGYLVRHQVRARVGSSADRSTSVHHHRESVGYARRLLETEGGGERPDQRLCSAPVLRVA
eukprot:701467-Rhodomonas_salina.1